MGGHMNIATMKIRCVAAPATAEPCDPGNPELSGGHSCGDCAQRYGHFSRNNDIARIYAGFRQVPDPGQIPADCYQYTIISDRAVCVDQHLAGQR